MRSATRHHRHAACLAPWLLLLALGCAAGTRLPAEDPADRKPAAAQHAIHDARLAAVMLELEKLALISLPQAVESRAAFQTRRRELVEVSSALAESSLEIQRIAASLELAPAEREEFRFLAETLRRRATTLASEAPYASVAELTRRASELRNTCNHCHGRYRAPLAGALRPGPARWRG